jgi:hypothetical protein
MRRARPLEVLRWSSPAAPVASVGPSVEADDRPIQAPTSEAAYFDAALRLSAIALLLRPMGSWLVRPAILAVAVLVLIFPRLLRSSLMWGALAGLTAIRIAEDWPLADNHIYLLGYWLLAVALSLRASDALATLAFTSRWLVGLAFAFAVLWKAVLSPDFVDGRFFRVTLLTDPRFGAMAQLIGGLSREELDANRQALALLPEGAELLDAPVVHEPVRLRMLAKASTFGILALEAAVALLMLTAAARTSVRWRHAVLLLFCGITYAFAPVAGFGWLLLVMGLAQVEPRQIWFGRAYIAAFVVVIFYDELPWADLMLDWLR